MEDEYPIPITVDDARKYIGMRHLAQLSKLSLMEIPDEERIPIERERGNFQDTLEKWSSDNKEKIDYAVKQRAFGGPSGSPINWGFVFLAFMESATVYLRDSAMLVKAVKLYNAGKFEEALKMRELSVSGIKKIAGLWHLDFQMLCDLVNKTPSELWFGNGPYCGAFYSRDPAAPFIGITFKGTYIKNWRTWITNLRYRPTKCPSNVAYGANISKGVRYGLFGHFEGRTAFEKITGALQDISRTMPNDSQGKIVTHVTGHSLGGSYSSICFTQYMGDNMLPPLVTLGDLYTFASPRNGEEDFAIALRDRLGQQTGSSWRIVNEGDPAPTLPPLPVVRRVDFNHVDTGYRIAATKDPFRLPSEIGTKVPKGTFRGREKHKTESYYWSLYRALYGQTSSEYHSESEESEGSGFDDDSE